MLAVCNLVAFAGVNARDDLIVEEHVKEPLLLPRNPSSHLLQQFLGCSGFEICMTAVNSQMHLQLQVITGLWKRT